jgi:hypothetical protein
MTEYKIGDRVPLPPKQSTRRMIDMVPNGDDFRSRIYGAHLRNKRDHGPSERETDPVFVRLGRDNISCPTCLVEAGQPCISTAKTGAGAELKTLHPKRFFMAKRLYARKEKP